MEEKTINVLLVQPYREPRMVEIADTLEAKQQLVGGYIELIQPFDDPVGLVCNEEGKMRGLPLNRALWDDEGEVCEIIAGDFFICGLGDEDFISLTPAQAEKYMAHFKQPEDFLIFDGQIIPFPVDPIKPEQPEQKLKNSETTYRIYQVKNGDAYCNIIFSGTDMLKQFNLPVDPQNYDLVYTGVYGQGMTLEGLYQTFNTAHPQDYQGRSMSVSDVIVLSKGGKETAHFVDSVGFTKLDSFITPESPKKKPTRGKGNPGQRRGGEPR